MQLEAQLRIKHEAGALQKKPKEAAKELEAARQELAQLTSVIADLEAEITNKDEVWSDNRTCVGVHIMTETCMAAIKGETLACLYP